MILAGHRTWIFEQKPVILSTGTVGGPFEANGAIAEDFDLLHADLWLGQDSYEKAHKVLFEEACQKAMEKGGIQKDQVQFILAGDLINQITPTSFASRTIGAPYFGLFGACSTSMEGLALGAYIVNTKGAKYLLTGASSHAIRRLLSSITLSIKSIPSWLPTSLMTVLHAFAYSSVSNLSLCI